MARSSTHKKKEISKDPSYKKKKPLGYFPVQRKMQLAFLGAAPLVTGYGDAGSMLSRTNNRLYRYGKLYELKLDLSAASTAGTTFEIFALPNTWYIQKAFEHAKMAYDKAYEEEKMLVNPTNIARWRDFRIRMGQYASFGGLAGADQWAYPVTFDVANVRTTNGTPSLGGDFPDSFVVDADGTTKHFSWGQTSNATQYNVLGEYDLAGNQTRSPATGTGTMPYEGLQADSSAAEASALQTQGQDPPYNATTFPQEWVKVGELYVGANGAQKLSTGFFHAPCGVFIIRTSGSSIGADAGDNISLEVRAGKYKGVSALNMERM